MTKPKLTPKQKRFIEEYLIDLNAARAARTTGYRESIIGVIVILNFF